LKAGLKATLAGLPAIVLVLALWELLPRIGILDPVLLPTFSTVLVRLGRLAATGELAAHCLASLLRVLVGFAAAALVSIPLGIALGLRPGLLNRVSPLLGILRPISPPAWIPLAILWFGIGNRPAIFINFAGTASAMLVGLVSGARALDTRLVQAALTLGATRSQTVRWVAIPAMLPVIMAQLRIGLGLAWMAVIAAEMVAVRRGLGYMMVQARNLFQTDTVLAGMAVVGLLGWTLDRLLLKAERRVLCWRSDIEVHELFDPAASYKSV